MVAAFLTVHFVRWKTKRKEPLAVQVILSRPVNVIPVMGMLEPPKIYWCWSWTVDQRRIRPSHASQQNLQVWVVPISESPYPQPQARPWNGILVFTRLQENVSGFSGCGSRNTKDQHTGHQSMRRRYGTRRTARRRRKTRGARVRARRQTLRGHDAARGNTMTGVQAPWRPRVRRGARPPVRIRGDDARPATARSRGVGRAVPKIWGKSLRLRGGILKACGRS